MHLICDCKNAINRWRSVLDPLYWTQFNSLEGADWIKWNLHKEAGKVFTKKLTWASLFPYICWDIWVTRCNKLFDPNITNEEPSAFPSFFKAYCDQDMIANYSFYKQDSSRGKEHQPLQGHYVTLEVDGSVLQDGRSGCRGILKDEKGGWICGFSCKLTTVPSAIVETRSVHDAQ
ncbi:uncharacterized protein LOC114749883 [Neltuma alba]|uniref:uncharacterized protein LOC114749883 n=1 Tax=Neltuma alba TaxID=207710 RepID=UPI0010A44DD8|nr:uncharacterized protein LOC114749883 [Prosopis alba]